MPKQKPFIPYTPRRGRPRKAESALIDWEEIQMLWEQGFSPGEISRRYPVSSRAVQIRGENGWDREKRAAAIAARGKNASFPKGADVSRLPAERPPPLTEFTAEVFLQMLLRVEEPRWPETMPHAEVAAMLSDIAQGSTITMACEAAGISQATLLEWRNKEPRLDALVRKARAVAARALLGRIAQDKDWRAAAWVLERGEQKAEFAPVGATSQAPGLTIEVKVNRGEDVLRDAGVIDLVPDGEEVVHDAKPAAVTYQQVKEETDAGLDAGVRPIAETEGLPRPADPADPLRGSRRRR